MVSPFSEVRSLAFVVAVFWVCVSIDSSRANPERTDPAEIDVLRAFRRTLTNSKQQLPNWFKDRIDPCNQWTGVICEENDYPESLKSSSFLHVTEIRLLRLSLNGTLAPELGNLKALKYLNVMWNNMSGSIPDTIGNLTSLSLLLLNGNHFSGSLPDSLGNLVNLKRMQIDENEISGPVPTSFQNLSAMEHLHLNNNSISGSIPPELGKLSKLVHLLLDNNDLTGPLPPELSNLPSLTILQLDNNPFSEGTIPETYTEIPTLLKLSLRNCNIIGNIPDFSKSTTKLLVLDLSRNSLNGSIPSNFPSGTTAIDLSHNNLTGAIPEQLGSLENFTYLSLSNNNLSGAIPKSLGSASIYNNPSINIQFVWDIQNNNISSWPNNATQQQLTAKDGHFLWLAGNPVCVGQFAINCDPTNVTSELQIGGSINTSSNLHQTKCSNCRLPFRLVPHAQENGCRCAVPIIVWYRLKSPGFSVFDLYEPGFLVFISSNFTLSINQVDIFDYTYEPGPRLSMHLHLFPASGQTFNESEIKRLMDSFCDWEVKADALFGPYELLNFMVSFVGKSNISLSTGGIAGIVLGVLAVGVLVAVATLLLVRKSQRPRRRRPGAFWKLTRIKTKGLQEWTWKEMEQFTNKFSDSNVLGVGGFGKVYVGVLSDGHKVAIKRVGTASGSSQQFQTEIELLSRVHHRNLVALEGFCQDEVSGDQFLVYEFMENGTVQDHLPPNSTTPLNFPTRLRVALGAARGVNYLHTEANPAIYHRDIKASNILLDKKFQAKVSDFGVSKNAPEPDVEGGMRAGVDTLVKGTPGYLDPEYCLTHSLTDKSDVYSFGVFLMVLLTGRHAITEGKNIVRHVTRARDANMLWSLVDTHIAGQCPVEIAVAWAKLALRCCAQHPKERPSMAEVLNELDALNKDEAVFRCETDSSHSSGVTFFTPSATATTSSVTSTFTATGDTSVPSTETTVDSTRTQESGEDLLRVGTRSHDFDHSV